MILRISERAVRQIEKRAIEKLRRHPVLQGLWREMKTGDIKEATRPASSQWGFSRAQNRALFKKVFAALVPGGRVLIRDIVMEPSRTRPVPGALFAVNMLVGTESGGTFTLEELRADLASAGFAGVRFLRRGEAMDSVVCAEKA